MNTIISALRDIVGNPDFYVELDGRMQWDYASMFEYCFACLVLLLVIGSIFKVILKLFGR